MKKDERESLVKSFLLFFITIEIAIGIIAYFYYQEKITNKDEAIFLEMKNYNYTLKGESFTVDLVTKKPSMQTFLLHKSPEELFVYFPIPQVDDTLLKVIYPSQEYDVFVKLTKNQILFSLGILSLFVFAISIVFALYSLKPVRKLLKKLEHLATYDALTGIMNRRLFFEMGEKYLNEAERLDKYFFLLMIDIDYFKKINDTYGHHGGDKVLIGFSKRVESILRKSDLFGRIGGEEFAVIIVTNTAEDASNIAEKIRRDIQATTYDINHSGVSVTISIGMVQSRVDEPLVDMIKRADDALYSAKNKGRNCIVKDLVYDN